MRLFSATLLMVVAGFLAACQTTSMSSNAQATQSGQRWVGVMAVMESPLVNQIIAENGNEPALYGPALRAALDAGRIQPAPGRYCLIPYREGRAYDSPQCFETAGVYTMWAPAHMVQPGVAICVQVPSHWPAVAGQRWYPAAGGRSVNCFDFDERAARRDFAGTRHTAAMVVAIQPRN